MNISITDLLNKSTELLTNSGASQEDAAEICNHLLEQELLGKSSHGFFRLKGILNCLSSIELKKKSIQINDVTTNIAKVNSENALGLVVAAKATDNAIDKANVNGLSLVAATGYSGTTGSLGYYARKIAKNGLIGMVMCTSEYAVAPWGGREAILGTNPIAFAFPDGNRPIIVDFATAAMTYGELMLKAQANETVPTGIVLNKDGYPSTDPNDADNGCQLPMAEHKGYALGLAIEILSGLFIGAKAGKDAVVASDGITILCIKPSLFVSENSYLGNMQALKNEILSSPTAADSTIRIPGETSLETISKGLESGTCSIPEAVYSEIMEKWNELKGL